MTLRRFREVFFDELATPSTVRTNLPYTSQSKQPMKPFGIVGWKGG